MDSSILVPLFFGFLVALVTGFLIGGKKAATFPGGSLASGYYWAYTTQQSILLGIVLGVAGWIIYVLLRSWLNRRR